MANAATAVVNAKPESIDSTIQALWDTDTPLYRLVLDDGGAVGAAVGALLVEARSVLAALSRESRDILMSYCEDDIPPVYRDSSDGLARAIVIKALSPAYFAMPDSLLHHADPASRVFTIYPELLQRLDRKGLLQIDRHWDATNQALFYRDHALSYHQFLRREFTSRLNDQLLGSLIALWKGDPSMDLRVALDERRVTPREKFQEWFEADFLHGRPLTEDNLDDPAAVGTTRYWVVPGNHPDGWFKYVQLAVTWSFDAKAGLKNCQIEELLSQHDARPAGGSYILNRYLHAQRDVANHRFIHCDGAVRGYTTASYALRRTQTHVAARTGADAYRKVWRIDGAIGTSAWADLVVQWFRHNELAMEYLSAIADQSQSHEWDQLRDAYVRGGTQFERGHNDLSD